MYKLIDSGNLKKLEKFGDLVICRPSTFAVWETDRLLQNTWSNADITFERKTDKEGTWLTKANKQLEPFQIKFDDIKFELRFTSFGHLGLFPEQIVEWLWIKDQIKRIKAENSQNKVRVLNLFAYTGGSTLACIQAEADEVVHVDSSKTVVEWAKHNSKLNGYDQKTIRYIVEDASKFVEREIKRGSVYDGIILDPPTYGRGVKNEIFKIESDILPLLENCKNLLKPHFFINLTAHTPGFTQYTLFNQLKSILKQGTNIEAGEMLINSENNKSMPSGFYARATN